MFESAAQMKKNTIKSAKQTHKDLISIAKDKIRLA